RDSYGQDVSHLFLALEERIDEKKYRDLSEELRSTWSHLLKWHQRKNQRIPPKVIRAFNEMNRLLKMT
ncbi:MAG: hypothetical protein VX278_16270, partial [Myxococcota bacterium]|nr:hypothetical protein [Myxococcota bacterium]